MHGPGEVHGSGGVHSPGGVVYSPGGAWSGGCMVWGVHDPGGLVSQHALRQTPPVNRMTNGCKNITLP